MRRGVVVMAVALFLLAAGCAGRQSSHGFTLPAGDAEAGKVAFVSLDCSSCHRVPGIDLPAPERIPAVLLGGAVPVVRTDGSLTTDIINPSVHLASGYEPEVVAVQGVSRMPDYTHKMTVRQMADLVAFLQTRYEYAPIVPDMMR